MESQHADENLVDLWFRLKDHMLGTITMGAGAGIGVRPPSLRDAAYAYMISMANKDNPPLPELTESFVNGLELGAMQALREAWTLFRINQIANLPLKDRSADVQGSSEAL
jgi:hypothetical protein